MPKPAAIRVIHRNLRWEVSAGGLIRPMIDWLCTRERAIDHALERALEAQTDVIVVERCDGTVEEVIPLEAVNVSRSYQ